MLHLFCVFEKWTKLEAWLLLQFQQKSLLSRSLQKVGATCFLGNPCQLPSQYGSSCVQTALSIELALLNLSNRFFLLMPTFQQTIHLQCSFLTNSLKTFICLIKQEYTTEIMCLIRLLCFWPYVLHLHALSKIQESIFQTNYRFCDLLAFFCALVHKVIKSFSIVSL